MNSDNVIRNILNIIGDIGSLLIPFFMVIVYWLMRRDAVRNSIRETTQLLYKEWWSDEFNSLRKYFYREFLTLHRKKLLGKCIREIEIIIGEDQGRIRKLCYFFERVGWLGAAGLIDVDYILGPMQHCMRSVWLAMEPFILKERQFQNATQGDPVHHSVYLSGFEWLFKRSEEMHQADLIRNKFRRPRLRSLQEINELRFLIDNDEEKFRREL